MAFTYNDYSNHFHGKAGADGLSYTFKQTLSVVPAAIGYTIDTLLGLDNLLGNDTLDDRYNYFNGPFGTLLGGIPLVIGLVLGYIMEVVLRAPGFIGMFIDWSIAKLWELTHPLERPPMFPFNTLMTDNWIGSVITNVLFNVVTDRPLKDEMRGPIGFVLGYVPALTYYFVNRIAAIGSSVIKYSVDHVCDTIRFVYSSIGKLFRNVFGIKQVSPAADADPAQDTSEQLKEDNTAQPPVQKRRRIIREKEVEDQIYENDKDLQRVINSNEDIFATLNISPELYRQSSVAEKNKLVKDGYRKASLNCHPDKTNSPEAMLQWQQINSAKSIFGDNAKYNIYMANYEKRNRFFQQPANSLPTPFPGTRVTPKIPDPMLTQAPTTTQTFTRTRITRG